MIKVIATVDSFECRIETDAPFRMDLLPGMVANAVQGIRDLWNEAEDAEPADDEDRMI